MESITRDATASVNHERKMAVIDGAEKGLEQFNNTYPLGISRLDGDKVLKHITQIRKVGGGEVSVHHTGQRLEEAVAEIALANSPANAVEVAAKIGFLLGQRFSNGEER